MPASRLGILRAAIGGYAVWYVWTRFDLICNLSKTNQSLFDPVGVLSLMSSPISGTAVEWLLIVTIVTGVLFVSGTLFRISGPAFAVLLLVTLCYRNSWSMIYHMHNALVLHVLALGFSSSADGFSVDRLLKRKANDESSELGWQYGWPVRLICGVTVLSYFLAGFAKLVGPDGLAWASGEAMRSQVAVDSIRKEILEGLNMQAAFYLYDSTWLFLLMGIATFVLELGAPLFALHRRTAQIWAVSTWLMHVGILIIMGIKFRYQLSFIMFLPFFPVEKWGQVQFLIRSNK